MRVPRIAVIVCAFLCLSSRGEAQAARAGAGAARKAVGAELRALMKRDFKRDAASAWKRLAEPRRVFRFTTPKRALSDSKNGLSSGSHMTVGAGPGRPPNGKTAARKYGLPTVPSRRELIELPTGTRIRSNKAVGGGRGVGEITVGKQPPTVVKRAIKLRK